MENFEPIARADFIAEKTMPKILTSIILYTNFDRYHSFSCEFEEVRFLPHHLLHGETLTSRRVGSELEVMYCRGWAEHQYEQNQFVHQEAYNDYWHNTKSEYLPRLYKIAHKTKFKNLQHDLSIALKDSRSSTATKEVELSKSAKAIKQLYSPEFRTKSSYIKSLHIDRVGKRPVARPTNHRIPPRRPDLSR